MRPILSPAGQRILDEFAGANAAIVLDYDGTLAPIVADPRQAEMRARTRELLDQLAHRYPCAVLSGRGRDDALRFLGDLAPAMACVVGNHGLEWDGHAPGVAQVPLIVRKVARWRARLERGLAAVGGIDIEDKRLSLAVHYRRSRRKKEALAAIAREVASLHRARVFGGKHVVNVVPEGAPHKGIALQKIRSRLGCDTAIFLGDDVSDEDVFALDEPGRLLSIRVGRSASSHAGYFVRDQLEVDALLAKLVGLRARPGPRAQGPAAERSQESALGAVLEFLRILWAVDHGLHTVSKRMEQTLGLTAPQRFVVRIVRQMPGVSAGRLAEILRIDPATLTGVLKRLERRHLIRRELDPRDARRALFVLTPAGRELSQEQPGTIEAVVRQLLASLPPESIDVVSQVLSQLAEELAAASLERHSPARAHIAPG